jgi:hypothetical protein
MLKKLLVKSEVKRLFNNDFDSFKKWVKSYPQFKGISEEDLIEDFNFFTDSQFVTPKKK